MTLDIVHIVLVAAVQFCASLLQSSVGFAYALFATPLLVRLGFSLPQAMALTCLSSLVQTATGVRQLAHEVRWKLVWSTTAIRYAATLVGALALKRLAALPAEDIRMTVGILILTIVTTQLAVRPAPRERLAPFWTAVAFTVSGLLAGVVGMGGPPVVLWAMAHDWSSTRTRAFLFAVFLLSLPFQIAVLAVMFPRDTLTGLLIALASLPVLAAGTFVGMKLGARISKPVLQWIAYGLLLVVAVSSALPRALQYVRGI